MPSPKRVATGASLARLVDLMALLRGPRGCPWDREQTHASLKPYAIEETYEVLEAIDSGFPPKLCEELGDLLLQIVFHAQLAAEAEAFDIDTVITVISEKLIRRHPHVFADVTVTGAAEVIENWERIKGEEKSGERSSALDGVPKGLPALMKAEKLQSKASKVGFDWPEIDGSLRKAHGEFREFEAALQSKDSERQERLAEELGDILFTLANVARFLRIDPEMALEQANTKFLGRFQWMEEQSSAKGRKLEEMTPEELDGFWEAAKHTYNKR
jgi:tetrapyrrole methylase family protein/MazG family protein